MRRSTDTMLLDAKSMSCILCGQQYFYSEKDLTKEELVILDERLWKEKDEDRNAVNHR